MKAIDIKTKLNLKCSNCEKTVKYKFSLEYHEAKFHSENKVRIYSRDCGWPTNICFLHISSSYAKILGGELFRTREFPRSWSKAKDGKEKRKRPKVGDFNGQATHGARKHAWRTQAAWANTHGARKPPGPI